MFDEQTMTNVKCQVLNKNVINRSCEEIVLNKGQLKI